VIYELRTYWAAPGKREALHNRFRTLTMRIFARLDMQVVGFWTPDPITSDTGDLVYIMAFPDRDTMQDAWNRFRADPEWQAGKLASEQDGLLAAKVTSTVLLPTDYSPIQ
jgi:hypothetical protein